MSNHEAYLRNALTKYRYPDIAKRDILTTFQSFKDLKPNLDTFVFNDGNPKKLLCLDGTIPVTYKAAIYNIPVCLWLMETHPYNPPMVYVKPTQTMRIKQSRHVDANGKVYLPYLHEWKHPQSDLMGLIQVLTIVFGEEPPVFSRSTTTPATGVSPVVRPPYPAQQPAPYPTAGAGMPMPTIPGSAGYPSSTASGYQPPASTYPNTTQNTPYPGYPTYSAQGGAGYPSYSAYPAAQTASTQSSGTVVSNSSGSLSEEQIRASLLSAVEDKMRRRLKEIFAQAQAEMAVLKKTSEDLNKGKNLLEDMLQRLEKEQNDVERNVTILKEKNEEIQTILTQIEGREEVNIDEAIMATAPLYKQLINVFAEEQATEDAIYYLSKGLQKDVIDLDVYLKQVRELSRKQFMLRALIQRCRQKAGLPEVSCS